MSGSRGVEALVGVWRLEEIRDRAPDRLTLAPLTASRKGIEVDRVLVWRRA